MGCHTWYRIPKIIGKKDIKTHIQNFVNECEYYSEGWKKTLQYALDNDIEDVICELDVDLSYFSEMGWILYENLELTNEPRIKGYPETIIKSHDEFLEALTTGLKDEDGNLQHFYYDENRLDYFVGKNEWFFKTYPKGIMKFG